MQIYIVLMVLAVFIGTLFDVYHKGSAKFFARRKEKSRAAAQEQLSGPNVGSDHAKLMQVQDFPYR